MRLHYSGVAYDRTLALITGAVRPEGVELQYSVDTTTAALRRMYLTDEFDAGELSLANYIIMRALGDDRFVALPVFPSRAFRHNSIYVYGDAGITAPGDLRGRRVGISGYLATAAFWVRGFLQHDYGVRPEEIHWLRGDAEQLPLPLPAGVDLAEAPSGNTLSELLEAGAIDALMGPRQPPCFVAGSPRVRRLFPDYAQVESDYYQRTGYFPIMHVVGVRRAVYDRDRSLARTLYAAFAAAKDQAYALLADSVYLATSLPLQIAYAEESRRLFGGDPFPYGVERNRATVTALARYIHEQGLADRTLGVDELFATELLQT
jgi:4,5-dihydroxyphthalate decarboxylase